MFVKAITMAPKSVFVKRAAAKERPRQQPQRPPPPPPQAPPPVLDEYALAHVPIKARRDAEALQPRTAPWRQPRPQPEELPDIPFWLFHSLFSFHPHNMQRRWLQSTGCWEECKVSDMFEGLVMASSFVAYLLAYHESLKSQMRHAQIWKGAFTLCKPNDSVRSLGPPCRHPWCAYGISG